jgi:dTMP kinase
MTIRPALDRGEIVLCDRFGDSTVVYQGHARGLSIEMLRSLNAFATDSLSPNLTFLLDLEPEIGLARISDKDRLDSESNDFHRAVREGFLKEAAADPDRWFVVDASMNPAAIIDVCAAEVRRRMQA